MTPSKWYSAALVLECVIAGETQHESEIQVRLVEASSHDEAYAYALRLGAEAELSYRNEAGEEVLWRFRGLSDLTELSDTPPRHGDEVYSMSSKTPASELVCSRERLSAFWFEANRQKTARQILDGE